MERGTVANGIVEWLNSGILESGWNERLTTPYRFKWTNWACALAIDVEQRGMIWIPHDNGHLYKECFKAV